MKCDGGCSINNECKGEVVPILVTWGLINQWESRFNYCQYAIDSDRKAGLEVKILEQGDQNENI